MIQRIQSLWLLLAAVFMFLVFRLPYAGAVDQDGTVMQLFASGNLGMFILAILLCLIPFITIFLFKKRPTQKNLIWLGILLAVVFIVMMYFQVEKATTVNTRGEYKFGAIFPILYIVLLIMAYRGVRKDEKLIKSVDRLR